VDRPHSNDTSYKTASNDSIVHHTYIKVATYDLLLINRDVLS